MTKNITIAEKVLDEYNNQLKNNPYASLSYLALTFYYAKYYTYANITYYKFNDNSKLVYDANIMAWVLFKKVKNNLT